MSLVIYNASYLVRLSIIHEDHLKTSRVTDVLGNIQGDPKLPPPVPSQKE
jgi:hypothetical protein